MILSFSDCLTCFAAAFALCLKLRCANRKLRQKFRQKNRFIWNFVIHFKNLLLFQTLLTVNMHHFSFSFLCSWVVSTAAGDSGCGDIRGMEISVNQRVEGITSQLPMHYCMVRPHISLVPQVATSTSEVAQVSQSVNWSEGDGSIEIVDGLEGKTVEG